MSLRIVCSVYLVRHPVGGHTWHHLQYLIGLRRLGHEVVFFEHFGWADSCYDADRNMMTGDPSYGVRYLENVFRRAGLDAEWCYLAEDDTAHGISRARLAEAIASADLYLNLSNINWIPELETCQRRALVDTDPVFSQTGRHGVGAAFDLYDVLFTYGENVHKPFCTMPTAGHEWLPTRQPIVLDLWPVTDGPPNGAFTSVMNWVSTGEVEHEGRIFGH